MAEENGLEVAGQLASVGVPTASLGEATASTVAEINFHSQMMSQSIAYLLIRCRMIHSAEGLLLSENELCPPSLAKLSSQQCLTIHIVGMNVIPSQF